MERWSRAARLLMWTLIRLSEKFETLKKINKDHAVELKRLLLCITVIIVCNTFRPCHPSLTVLQMSGHTQQ